MPSELIPWRHEMERLKREMDQLYERLLGWVPARRSDDKRGWIPLVDMNEDENGITVRAEIPGVEAKNIEISLEGNVLTLRGERKRESVEADHELCRSERSYGPFERSIRMPVDVDPDQARASYRHGVITVELVKADKKRPKKVDIATD